VGPLLGGWLLDNFWWGSVFLINVPVVAIALVAVALLMPESHGARSRRIDIPGIVLSSLGLAGVTYGCIKAGANGWTDPAALAMLLAGAVVLAVFVAWERRAGRHGMALVQLELFRSAGFTWGTILTTFVSFAMFGILFAMPQYFQGVRGLDSLGTGLRMLPMIGGMVIGMVAGTRLQTPRKGPDGRPASAPPVGPKILVAAGFVVMAAGLAVGATTSAVSGTAFTAAWFGVAGLGLGLAMPAAMNAALGALSAERSGSGSALITAMRQVGATIGVAVLGTVLLSAYRSQLDLGGLPAAAAGAVRTGVIAGVGVALHLHSAALLDSVHAAFAHGLDVMLAVCAGIAGLSALLALAFLPRRVQAGGRPAGGGSAAGDPGDGRPAGGPDVAAVTGSGAPFAPPSPGGQDQGHDHARR
jgi:hypothetical protein